MGLKRLGKKKWRRAVFDVVARLTAALEPDYVVLGGGNAKAPEGTASEVPCRRQRERFPRRVPPLGNADHRPWPRWTSTTEGRTIAC